MRALVPLLLMASQASAANLSYPLSLSTGWNLIGNSLNTSLDVPTTYRTQTNVVTVWKWNAANSTWAFYAPSLETNGTLAVYAASKGYAVLATINPGEGYWVNVASPVDAGSQSGTGFSLAAAGLTTGWNLSATADNVSPATFTTTIGNVTTLWAWDNANNRWFFYAPSQAADGSLASYIGSKGYEDFGVLMLGDGLGFWVNYVGSARACGVSSSPCTVDDYWQLEDTGLVIQNDNPDTTRYITSIENMDLNGDGVFDSVLVGPELPNNAAPFTGPPPASFFSRQAVHVLLGGSTPTSGAALFPSGRPSYIASGWAISYDINGDGRPDLFLADIGPDTPPYPGVQNVLWLSGSSGWLPVTMPPSVTYAHGASAGRVAGNPAIFVNALCCGVELVPYVYVYRDGALAVDRSLLPELVTETTGPGSTSPARLWTSSAIADLDGDGLDDLVLGNFSAANPNDLKIGNYVIFGSTSGWNSSSPLLLPHPEGGSLSTRTMLSISAVDIDGDGKRDLVLGLTSYYSSRGIQILKNNGDRTFTDISAQMLGDELYVSGSPSGHIYPVDLNGDGCVDLVEAEAANLGGNWELGRILLNDCKGKFVNANAALGTVLSKLPHNQNILPFIDYTGRTSLYVPRSEPSTIAGGVSSTRYFKLKNVRNLPTPVDGKIVF